MRGECRHLQSAFARYDKLNAQHLQHFILNNKIKKQLKIMILVLLSRLNSAHASHVMTYDKLTYT